MREHDKTWTEIINEKMGTGNTNNTEMNGCGCIFFIVLLIAAWILIPRLGEWMSRL